MWKPDGTLGYVNDYGLKSSEYTSEELIGKSVMILVPDVEKYGQRPEESGERHWPIISQKYVVSRELKT